MSTTVLLGLTSFEKIGGQWIFGGASDFSNPPGPVAPGLMLRAVKCCERGFTVERVLNYSLLQS